MKKIIAGSLAATMLITGLAAASADFETRSEGKYSKFGISDEQKIEIENMSNDEKRAFFQEKKTEMKAEREVKEAVIDKLLSGNSLSAEEKILRQEIISERAERKAKMQERKTQIEEIRALKEKKENGETLSEDEEAKLEEMKGKYKK
jgi:hypothetical protein